MRTFWLSIFILSLFSGVSLQGEEPTQEAETEKQEVEEAKPKRTKRERPPPLIEKPKKRPIPRGFVIHVERRIAATREEKPPKEFYLDIGKMDDVRLGDVFHVFRELPIVHMAHGEPLEFLPVKIAEIQITTAGESTSVGRLLGMVDLQSLPKLDYAVIMVGDRVRRKIELPFVNNS